LAKVKFCGLKRNEPDTFRQLEVYDLRDFIRTRLGFPAVIDYCMASTSLPYDIRKGEYSEVIMKEIGVTRAMFSDPFPSDAVLGEIGLEARNELDLPRGVKLVTGGHDAILRRLGAGITDANPADNRRCQRHLGEYGLYQNQNHPEPDRPWSSGPVPAVVF